MILEPSPPPLFFINSLTIWPSDDTDVNQKKG